MRAVIKQNVGAGLTFKKGQTEPKVGFKEVKVKIAYAYPDGSDIHNYKWDGGQHPDAANVPYIMGHEGSGIVVEIGEGVTDFTIGDRVSFDSHIPSAVKSFGINYTEAGLENIDPRKQIIGIGANGLFADYAVFPTAILRKIPNNIPLEIAAMFEPAAIGVRAIMRAEQMMTVQSLFKHMEQENIVPRVFVFGATGVMGAVASAVAAARGWEVTAIGRTQTKLDIVDQMHPDIKTLNTSDHSVTEYVSMVDLPHIVIEVSGNSQVFRWMLAGESEAEKLAPKDLCIMAGGIWVQLGLFKQEKPNGDVDAFRRIVNATARSEVLIVNVIGRTKPEWDEIIRIVGSGEIDLKPLISNRFKLEEIEKALETKAIKNLIEINPDIE